MMYRIKASTHIRPHRGHRPAATDRGLSGAGPTPPDMTGRPPATYLRIRRDEVDAGGSSARRSGKHKSPASDDLAVPAERVPRQGQRILVPPVKESAQAGQDPSIARPRAGQRTWRQRTDTSRRSTTTSIASCESLRRRTTEAIEGRLGRERTKPRPLCRSGPDLRESYSDDPTYSVARPTSSVARPTSVVFPAMTVKIWTNCRS